MPEFAIEYLGKFYLEFCFCNKNDFLVAGQSEDKVSEFINNSYESYLLNGSTDDLVDYITCLLLLKDYSSSIIFYNTTKITHPVLLYNLALATVYTSEYKLGLSFLQTANTQTRTSLLLEIYLNYLIKDDLRALNLFKQYQTKFRSQSVAVPRPRKSLFTRPNSRQKYPKKNSTHFLVPELKAKKPEVPSITPSVTNPNLCIRKIKIASENKPYSISRVSTLKNSKAGLNNITLHSSFYIEQLSKPDPLSKLPEIPNLALSIKPSKTLSHLVLSKTIALLQSSPKDTHQIYSLLKNLKFFQLYSEEIGISLLAISHYKFFRQGEVMFNEGDHADKMYVILQGSVSVQQVYKGLNIYVNSRYDGDVIGEYAIIRGSVEKFALKRSATCSAAESLHTLFIEAEEYNEIMSKAVANENVVISFLQSTFVFKNVAKVDLAYMANCLQIRTFVFEEVILEKGEVPKGLYMVVSGRVKAVYKKKEVEFPPKFFFGQKVILGQLKAVECRVFSNAVETGVILIEPPQFGLIYNAMRVRVLDLLKFYINDDL